jgi:hypothetical protein
VKFLSNWLNRNKSPLKKAKDESFMEAIKCMAFTIKDGRITNHGLSEYGAQKLLTEGRAPTPLEQVVVLGDGKVVSFDEWREGK